MLDEQLTVAEELRRLRLLIDRLPAIIGYWDRDLRNVIANDTYVTYFGLVPDEIRGRHMRDVIGDELFNTLRPYLDGVLSGRTQVFEVTLPDSRGVARRFASSYVPDIVDGEVSGFYCHGIDVPARVEAERVRDEALRLFQISMANAGDAVLTEVARRLSRAVSAPSTVYRLGGDEFIVLVPYVDRGATVADLAEHFRTALTGDYDVGSEAVRLSASVGCTSGPTDDVEDLIRRADADMYRHKSRRRLAVHH